MYHDCMVQIMKQELCVFNCSHASLGGGTHPVGFYADIPLLNVVNNRMETCQLTRERLFMGKNIPLKFPLSPANVHEFC
jgi:hypothetical protein